MKASLLLVVTAVALALAGTAYADGISPDDRGYSKATNSALTPGPDDRAVSRATNLDADWQPAPTVVRMSHRSFDWTDAGIGAVSGFGIALVLMGGLIMFQRRVVATA